jgi:hypothetical protein
MLVLSIIHYHLHFVDIANHVNISGIVNGIMHHPDLVPYLLKLLDPATVGTSKTIQVQCL